MRNIWITAPLFILLAGCANTPDELVKQPPKGTWTFTRNYKAVSECLVQALNHLTRPKAGEHFGERLIGVSHIETVIPGEVNDITQGGNAYNASYFVVRVESSGSSTSTARAFVIRTLATGIPEMIDEAALTCGATQSGLPPKS